MSSNYRFTKLPNWIWKENIKPYAKLVLFAIYRWTAGYGRDTYRISDSDITAMTGIKSIRRWRIYLSERSYITYVYEFGKKIIYTIPPPSSFRHTPTKYKGVSPPDSRSYREAKESNKEIIKESNALTNELIEEMKSKYPNKDVNAMAIDCRNYYKNKDVPLDFKFKQWCERERIDAGSVSSEFKLDSTGKFPIGYCAGCGESEFYTTDELNGDSKCRKGCKAQVLPSKDAFYQSSLIK